MEFYNFFLFSTVQSCSSWKWVCSIDIYLKYIPLLTLSVGVFAFYLAWKNYLRKSSIDVIGEFTINNFEDSNILYISSYTLENNKDKSVVIYAVYLRLGCDVYIELDNFRATNKTPQLILKAYEAHHQSFRNFNWYYNQDDKIDITEMLKDIKIKKRIVLSTSQGKHVTKKPIKSWFPNFGKDSFTCIKSQNLAGLMSEGHRLHWDEIAKTLELNKEHVSRNKFIKMIRFFKKLFWK